MASEGTLRVGTVQEAETTLGYITPDTGEEAAAVLPSACEAFNSAIPPVGTRVVYRQTRTRHEDGSEEALAAEVLPEDHDFHGTVEKDSGSFGFIQIDGKEDQVFVMPIACSAFGGKIPPLQTPVKFKVVMDHKTGRPRADFVRPQFGVKGGFARSSPTPAVQESAPAGVHAGQVTRIKGNFGFIQPDDGAEEVFFMPKGCKGFHGMPAAGVRVSFEMVTDEKTGRLRADNIYPEAAQGGETFPSAELLGSNVTGTTSDPGDKFGFITQDDGTSMFVLPGSCSAFGMVIPPAGTRVVYDVVADPKTGRPRAENVQPSISGGQVTALKGKEKGGGRQARTESWSQQDAGTGSATGVISRICNGFGFIDQEDGESMFVLPTSCKAFTGAGGYAEIPPVGTPVDYDVVADSKTGRPRAENVRPAVREGYFSGTISKSGSQFGFIAQDMQDGSDVQMFVLPFSCGGQIPPVGTRVTFTVVEDSKTGRPRAENVTMVGSTQTSLSAPKMQYWPAQPMGGMEMAMSGSIIQAGPTYGFIQPDDGSEKMFVLPGSCTSCNGDVAIPPLGTRVTYYVTIDQKTRKPRAEHVQLEAPQWASEGAGEITQCGARYGFIQQDNGESMFVMPAACVAFGSVIPPVGTRVTFRVVPDSKTGRPRAEDVCPEKAPSSYGNSGAWSGKKLRPAAKAGPY